MSIVFLANENTIMSEAAPSLVDNGKLQKIAPPTGNSHTPDFKARVAVEPPPSFNRAVLVIKTIQNVSQQCNGTLSYADLITGKHCKPVSSSLHSHKAWESYYNAIIRSFFNCILLQFQRQVKGDLALLVDDIFINDSLLLEKVESYSEGTFSLQNAEEEMRRYRNEWEEQKNELTATIASCEDCLRKIKDVQRTRR